MDTGQPQKDNKQSGAEKIDALVNDIQETRSRICNTFLTTIAAIAIPALTASLFRMTEIGWQPVMAVHIIFALALWFVYLFREKIPYTYLAGFIIIIFFLIGLSGMLQFGLVAAGTVFLVASSPIATLFFGGRVGIATMILTFCSAVVVGLLTVSGTLQYTFDLQAYSVAPSSWFNSIIGWGLTSTALTVSVHVFNKSLINALKVSRQHQQSLFNHQLSLEKIIEERDTFNLELQKALEEIKTLRGIIPICSYCHSIRDDEGAWNKIENYLHAHSEVQLTHGICPECMKKVREDSGIWAKKRIDQNMVIEKSDYQQSSAKHIDETKNE